jgi:hypothetical protein
MLDKCVICGEIIPEGRQVCIRCELTGPKELILILSKRGEQHNEPQDDRR